jgi:hypothetical protein
MSIKQHPAMPPRDKVFEAVLEACTKEFIWTYYPTGTHRRLDVLACVLDYARRKPTNVNDPFVTIWNSLSLHFKFRVARYLLAYGLTNQERWIFMNKDLGHQTPYMPAPQPPVPPPPVKDYAKEYANYTQYLVTLPTRSIS